MENKFSVIMAIKNEAEYLSYSLPLIYKLNPNEVILLIDNCSDNSLEIINKIISKYSRFSVTKLAFPSDSKDWKFRIAYIKRLGLKLASNDIILIVDADTMILTDIKDYLQKMNYYKHISFFRTPYPISFRHILQILYIYFGIVTPSLGGVNMVSKNAYVKCENENEAKNILSGEDTLLQVSIKRKYPVLCIHKTLNIHLRENESSKYQSLRGIYYWKTLKISFLKAIIIGILYFRLPLIKGYIKERFGEPI